MHFKKIEQKRNSLENIHLRVSNEKNILLINIMKLNKKLQFYVQNALINKELISSLKSQYVIKNDFINKNNKLNLIFKKIFKKPKQLWIYLTEEQKHSTDSYTRYEKMILKNTKKMSVDFITIGERAKEFCEQNKLSVLKSFNNSQNEKELAYDLSYLVKFLYVDELYDSVHFVINSNKAFSRAFTLLPLENFDVNKLTNMDKISFEGSVKNYEIYPNIEKFIDSQIDIFLSNAIHSLIIESYFYNAKNNLISTNQIIKQLDEDILKLNKQIIKHKREKEIEEIVMFFRKNKDEEKDINGKTE
ncbi:MSC_0622 family F1-like ATPase gamma subunit [Mycoplasma zalophidermidis]|uniref:F0F1 ATP synthase subunit gamma n=1 Tax=Mycoplasma zalophidermidis TaxID=398174 RepID=A0ABS6DR85_9MOLU|nr:F0F1 ATP synthase subunit gamma [Mycoplasma zalophidermidis]MBU4689453.1 F0F1 ATP synthase subunit gamma [Mycoplasma zalophidermidis]MBU4693331.1 F0F1 ATP synthase subunit gamma [Mycoplasma zalophidermidis]MCR8966371.1 F0F1 ATP synthase subunit gamma [Mycoplasma zalophidermidis]